MLPVSSRIFWNFVKQLFRNHAGVLQFCLRPGFIALEQVNHAFQESLRGRGSSGSIRSRVRIQARAQVISPSGSVSGGIEENCFLATLRSPFHWTATTPLNAAACNDCGATTARRSKILSAASKLR